MDAKTTVVLGGGSGGIVAVNRLRENLPRGHREVLVDRRSEQSFAPSYPWVALGSRRPEDISRKLEVLQQKGIDFVQAEVTGINCHRQQVETDGGSIGYDCLIIALGAEHHPGEIPGFSQEAYNIYELNGALKLRDRLEDFSGGTVTVFISRLPIKCEGAPYEISVLVHDHLTQKGMRDRVRLQVVTPEARPALSLTDAVGRDILDMLRQRGIDFLLNHTVASIKPGRLVLADGTEILSDLLIGLSAHRGNPACQNGQLTNHEGWVDVDPMTMATKYENVWAIGDAAVIRLPGRAGMLPKNGALAHTCRVA
ncbi:MAG: FAD-dependent oxidoreductase [Bacillota bacterium]